MLPQQQPSVKHQHAHKMIPEIMARILHPERYIPRIDVVESVEHWRARAVYLYVIEQRGEDAGTATAEEFAEALATVPRDEDYTPDGITDGDLARTIPPSGFIMHERPATAIDARFADSFEQTGPTTVKIKPPFASDQQ